MTLSGLASLTKTDMRAETVRHFRNLCCCVMPTSNRQTDRADPNLSRVLPHGVLVRLRALLTHLEQGRPLPYIGVGSQDKKATGQMVWPNKFHWPTDPFVLLEQTYARRRLHHALTTTFPNRDDVPDTELLTCFGGVDSTYAQETPDLITRYCTMEESMAPMRHTPANQPLNLGLLEPKPSPQQVHVTRLTHGASVAQNARARAQIRTSEGPQPAKLAPPPPPRKASGTRSTKLGANEV